MDNDTVENINRLASTFNSTAFTVVNNVVSRTRDKRTNEQEQHIDSETSPKVTSPTVTTNMVSTLAATPSVSEIRQNPSMEVALSPPNSPELGLVEKLMQQLNDLKEMVIKKNFAVMMNLREERVHGSLLLCFYYLKCF